MRRELDGFVMNRMQGALLEEAFRLVADGYCSIEDVDVGLKEGLALRWSFMGPFETIDLNAPGRRARLRRALPADLRAPVPVDAAPRRLGGAGDRARSSRSGAPACRPRPAGRAPALARPPPDGAAAAQAAARRARSGASRHAGPAVDRWLPMRCRGLLDRRPCRWRSMSAIAASARSSRPRHSASRCRWPRSIFTWSGARSGPGRAGPTAAGSLALPLLRRVRLAAVARGAGLGPCSSVKGGSLDEPVDLRDGHPHLDLAQAGRGW